MSETCKTPGEPGAAPRVGVGLLLVDPQRRVLLTAYLGRVVGGQARNCEPDKTEDLRWFELGKVPENLTMTARNAIAAYIRGLGNLSGSNAHS